MKYFKAILSCGVTLALIWVLQTKFGSVPPIGKLLNPCTGFWQNAESRHIIKTENLKIEGLRQPVVIRFDENMIPHIFAKNDHDLYLAQGYITARDRLWEMDVQTRQAAGRLAEIIGPKAVDIDRYHRRMGMMYGAENSYRAAMADPQIRLVFNAYTQGVNAYIHQLTPRDYPLEFKVLDYAPEEYKPINCVLLLKLMAETLSGYSDAAPLTNVLHHFGPAVTADLFPDHFFKEDPVIPAGTKWNFKPLTVPQPSKHFLAEQSAAPSPEKPEGIGSNNWAVAGSKTANGYPLLANDPHLNLTFPSIWYQIQLSAPGINVYGVTIPSAPGLVIGYNNFIAWGVTNVDANVYDWYQIKFNPSKTAYWYNNKWNPVKRRIEEIKIRGQKTLYDTVLYTHQGPVAWQDEKTKPAGKYQGMPVGHALRWAAHEESNELKTFYLLNRGKNYDDYRRALTYFHCPAQNFIFASIDKDIALTPNGRFPLKYKDQGKFLLDGTDPADDWQGWIPMEQNPTAKNPAQGFLSSANQTSADPTYPYYLNWRAGPYYRGHRINTRLAAMQKATVDSMRRLQNDNYSIFAEDALPVMLKYLDSVKLTSFQLQALHILKKWNKRYNENEAGASIFDIWWNNFQLLTWNDEFGGKQDHFIMPDRDRTFRLLVQDPRSRWFDNIKTKAIETGADIVNQAFVNTIDTLTKHRGKQFSNWGWGDVKQTFINHLASIPGWGTGQFKTGGSANVVNALRGNNGPSWRMVVQVGPKVKGYGVYPGGESGNPGSYFYDNMFTTWRNGKLNELLFLQSPDETSSRIQSTLNLTSK